MNRNPNTSGLRPFPRGTSGNPAGRPRSLLTSVKVREIIGRLFLMPCRDVEAVANDESAPAGEAIVAAVMMRIFRDGDAIRFNALLDRAVGRVKDEIEIPESARERMSPEERDAAIEELYSRMKPSAEPAALS